MSKALRPIALLTILFAAGVISANATPVSSYGNITAPIIFGSGNVNGNFTISTLDDPSGPLQLALRAKNYGGATIDGSSGIYHTGSGTSPLNVNRARWNYEFSIGGNSIYNYIFRLGVDQDPSLGTDFHFVDPLTYFGDNAKQFGPYGNLVLSQNSENVKFGSTPGGAFNLSTPGTYDFVLAAFTRGTTDFALSNAAESVDIQVQVPEPTPVALLGLGLVGLMFARRKSRKAA